MKQPKIDNPKDIAFLKTDNNSILITLIFNEKLLSTNFHYYLLKDKDVYLNIYKNKDETFVFELKSSASPYTFVIDTKRTFENNPTLSLMFQDEYKDYLYITCGFRQQGQNVMRIDDYVPVFVQKL